MLKRIRATAHTFSDVQDMVAEARGGLDGVDAAATVVASAADRTAADIRYTLATVRASVEQIGDALQALCIIAGGVILARYLLDARRK